MSRENGRDPDYVTHADQFGDFEHTLTVGEVRRARLFDGMPRYRSLVEFLAAVPARRRSVEHDFGVGWRLGLGSTWRISWIRATGEVYALELAPRSEVAVVAMFAAAFQVAQALGDWPAVCGEPSSLEWAVGQLRGSACRVG